MQMAFGLLCFYCARLLHGQVRSCVTSLYASPVMSCCHGLHMRHTCCVGDCVLIACAAHVHRRSLQAFDLRTKLYAGHISSVYRAVDKKSGITVGLKLYK